MKNEIMQLLNVDLSLFDGEGNPAPNGGESSSIEGVASPTESNEPQQVVYGKVEEPENVDTSNVQTEKESISIDPASSFEELIKGEYKEQFDSRVQGIINNRFKQTKSLESQLESLSPIVEALKMKYKTDDPTQLSKLLENDIITDLAYEKGIDPEHFKKQMEAERIIERENQRKQQEAEQQRINKQVSEWFNEAEKLAATDPEFKDFDLRKAVNDNKQFYTLLQKGVDVKTAWGIANFDNLKSQMVKDAEKQTLENIRAKQMRPGEAAAKSRSGVIVKSSTKDLSAEDRAEIVRRVQAGEKITF